MASCFGLEYSWDDHLDRGRQDIKFLVIKATWAYISKLLHKLYRDIVTVA